MSKLDGKFVPLPEGFYEQPTLLLAKSLLGCLLVKETDEGVAAGYIVETEAYIGPDDKAAHSYKNRRTVRTEVMFQRSGLVYSYLMHTHCLFNIVSGGVEKPEAVLIRALEPVYGIELMKERRGIEDLKRLTNGPGNLTKSLGITMEDYGHQLFIPPLYIAKGFSPTSISVGKRIGIDNSEEARDYPWRFWVSNNKYVSRHQKSLYVIT
ncbi:DNA-3-methyladenine glycosylase [Pseudoneobacillus rhizosphaerae]|uniref:Putative 3-methyladenine DNA glycosylase n=1 Tax=Pseudoneobacillus rhizosphaerae TaxID=2880968 RepID=A0A9C7GBA8_9BACI|nr:DNA-3-methyladenine glycosylase [Pseudoneobacillus rhizosphaerae]CAG9609426.1 Putative 3-methyladenine DNA glycosylase [Pseudoneobacillus rhizosphaerae]